jgi:LmbE family N-acetylglucosaminyl deacetylase
MTEVVLVVAAHPDDELLGVGGTIAHHAAKGDAVHVAIMGEGVLARYDNPMIDGHRQELERLGNCAKRANEVVGTSTLIFQSLPDNRMDGLDQLDINKAVEAIVQNSKPTIVYTHHAFDLNVDHRCIHEAVMTACRPLPTQRVKRILCFETLSSTEWQTPVPHAMFTPQYYVDITKHLDAKLRALKEYQSEMREWPHPRSLRGVEHLAHWRGMSIGRDAAEAFMVARMID